MKSIECDIL